MRDARRTTYGVGLALYAGGATRKRGAHMTMHVDVRVMFAARVRDDVSARTTIPPEPAGPRGHDIGIIAGFGMDFGSID